MPKNPARQSFARLGLAIFILFIVPIVFSIILATAIHRIVPELTENSWYVWLVSYIPLYAIAFPLYLLLLRRIPDTLDDARRGFVSSPQMPAYGAPPQPQVQQGWPAQPQPGWPSQSQPQQGWPQPQVQQPQAGWGLPSALPHPRKPGIGYMILLIFSAIFIAQVINIGLTLLNIVLGMATGYSFINGLSETVQDSVPLVNLIFGCLVAPLAEEYIFRWTLYKKLAGYGPKVYILVSAAVFGLFHGSFFQTPYAFVLGIVFAALLWHTHKLRYTIIAHMGVNLVGMSAGQILLVYLGAEAAVIGIFSMLFVSLVAFVIGLVMLVSNWKNLRFGSGLLPPPKFSYIIGNFGAIAYIVIVLLVIALSISPFDLSLLEGLT